MEPGFTGKDVARSKFRAQRGRGRGRGPSAARHHADVAEQPRCATVLCLPELLGVWQHQTTFTLTWETTCTRQAG